MASVKQDVSHDAAAGRSDAVAATRLLEFALDEARQYLTRLPTTPVGAAVDDAATLHALLGGPLGAAPRDPREVLAQLVGDVSPGLVHSTSPRFFGFVQGGALPVAIAADWLVSVWDQNPAAHVAAPAASVVQDVVGRWVTSLLGLPATASHALVSGSQMGHVTCLSVARRAVLQARGHDIDEDGARRVPEVRLLVSADRHPTIDRAARLLGIGRRALVPIATDRQGAMDVEALRAALADDELPTIVCAQAGDVHTGAFDRFEPIVEAAHARGAWVHVDGAFGLWAAASPRRRGLVAGVEQADSWSTDAHKWLNVPYDCGLCFVADARLHHAATSNQLAYLPPRGAGERNECEWSVPMSRRAQALPLYAALRTLGEEGVAALVDRCCDRAGELAQQLAALDGVEVLNDVVLNQVLVGFAHAHEADAVIAALRRDGRAWTAGIVWRGRPAMRVSVSNWATQPEDVELTVAAIADAIALTRSAGRVAAEAP